ncbi:hypothetical protein JCM33374_g622 [Metschnikowia sp. JCM 33374]|nr:hypothetical protein JCM33374_g622 [Metschnikowia sp. JCM 33374]
MSYELTFLGTSGGPSEQGNCCLLIKPAGLSYSQVLEAQEKSLLMIDAGSGWQALAETILNGSNGCSEDSRIFSRQLAMYEDSLLPHQYLGIPASGPFSKLKGSPLENSRRIFSKIAATLLSHPHLDHIQSMVLNSAGAANEGDKTAMYASKFTTDALNTHIFNGVIWPDLVSLGFLTLETISEGERLTLVEGQYTVTYFEVSHGLVANKCHPVGPYSSSAFLICSNVDQVKMLVFGDFEPDSISRCDKNSAVWKHVAPSVLDGTLKCVVVECSTFNRDPGANLYGHMTPSHLMAEFQRLESFCAEKSDGSQAKPHVSDLKVIVTHVKETYDGKDPRRRILSELQQLNESLGLNLNVSIATNGISVVV